MPEQLAADLVSAHRDLMMAYRAALDQSDQLDFLNRSFIFHVVAVSSSELHNRLVTRVADAKSLAADTKEFAQEMAKKDSVGRFISFTQAQARARFDLVKIVVILGTIFGLVADFLARIAFEAQQFGQNHRALVFEVVRAPVLLFLFHLYREHHAVILSLFDTSTKADEVLAATLDQAESRVFALTGSTAPRRPALRVVGGTGVSLLVVVVALVAWFLVHMLYETFAPPSVTLKY